MSLSIVRSFLPDFNIMHYSKNKQFINFFQTVKLTSHELHKIPNKNLPSRTNFGTIIATLWY